MAHTFDGAYHRFSCDSCGYVASEHEDEQIARGQAYRCVDREGWVMQHPGWVLVCPKCQAVEER
jgi:hypothetical protein